jgi:hypothetical protein
MSEHEEQSEETAEEREETMKDLDVPHEESGEVRGGISSSPRENNKDD